MLGDPLLQYTVHTTDSIIVAISVEKVYATWQQLRAGATEAKYDFGIDVNKLIEKNVDDDATHNIVAHLQPVASFGFPVSFFPMWDTTSIWQFQKRGGWRKFRLCLPHPKRCLLKVQYLKKLFKYCPKKQTSFEESYF